MLLITLHFVTVNSHFCSLVFGVQRLLNSLAIYLAFATP